MKNSRLPGVAVAAAIAMVCCHYFIWEFAPVEKNMGLIQKIFYIHMPMAWWSMISFFAVFVSGIMYLFRRKLAFDYFAAAAAEVGVLLCSLALITGSIWARKSWNVWWTWDPRLTTTLIMLFIYAGYLLVRTMGMSPQRQAMVCSVLGIVAFLDIPLVFISARLWRSIHPAVLASREGGLTPDMMTTLKVSIGAWALVWGSLVMLRYYQLRMRGELDAMLSYEDSMD